MNIEGDVNTRIRQIDMALFTDKVDEEFLC